MPKHEKAQGFTLIEVIAVLILIAIVSVVVLSRGTSTSQADLKANAEALKGHIRYAQMRAMNADVAGCNASFGMVISGGSYYMFSNCSTASKVVLPGAESSAGITLPSGMTVTPAPTTFSFDKWGRPYPSSNGTGSGSTIPLTINYSGLSEPINIRNNTGFAP
jgi:prepilin-type N-terminal cleavage/methylation domain-containing protein